MRRTRRMACTLGIGAGLLLAVAGSGATMAQGPDDPAHPAHIHEGLCPAPAPGAGDPW